MHKFSLKSKAHLAECHDDLQRLFNEVIKHRDCSIVEGYRSKEMQNHLFRIHMTKVAYPNSKHNVRPSLAVDVWPYPRPDWNDTTAWRDFAQFVMGVAAVLDISVLNGGLSWGWDYVHYELKPKG